MATRILSMRDLSLFAAERRAAIEKADCMVR
jgi:hypothetical protein